MIAAAPLDRPIFVVGTVRSGTTLLAECLGQHAQVAWLKDNGLELSTTWTEVAGVELGVPGVESCRCPPIERLLEPAARFADLRRAFSELLGRPQYDSKQRCLNKNPHLWNKLPLVRSIFPDARLVVTARDIRSTVLSTQMLWLKLERMFGVRHYLPEDPAHCWTCLRDSEAAEPARTFPGGDLAVLADYWLRVYERIDQAVEGFERPLLVKHRDLVADPEGTLAELHSGLDLAPQLAEPEVVIDRTRNNRWDKLLTTGERAQLEAWIDARRHRITRLRFADTLL